MGFYVILHYFERIFFFDILTSQKQKLWILYNNEIPYKGSNMTSILPYFICQLNHILIDVSLAIPCGYFWPFYGPIVFFTIFVKSTICHLTFGFYMHMFFSLMGPHDS